MPHDKQHNYATRTVWTGNLGEGTAGYRAYSRDHVISAEDHSGLDFSDLSIIGPDGYFRR